MVVPCGAVSLTRCGLGSSSGAAALRNSVNDDDPGAIAWRSTPGKASAPLNRSMLTALLSVLPVGRVVGDDPTDPDASRDTDGSATQRLLAALLTERSDEVLGVRLEHVGDLVEQRVDVLGELLLALGDVGRVLGLDLVDFVRLALRPCLAAFVSGHVGSPRSDRLSP